MSDSIIKRPESKRLVNTSGRPLRRVNHCIAHICGVEIDPPAQFCKEHWGNLPMHLRLAMRAELEWCRSQGRGADPATKSLLSALIQREAIIRAESDPLFKAELEKALGAEEPRVIQ